MTDYTQVTELPNSQATREQLARLYHRYHTAAHYAAGRRVLEVACGAGLGLGYLARAARSIVGGDYTHNLVRVAHSHYQQRVPLLQLDAQHLPFASGRFDLVVLFEAIYYLAHAEQFVAESHRLLSPDGLLLIGTVNKDWGEFAPSPHSIRYWSAPELRGLLTEQGFHRCEFYGAFPTAPQSRKEQLVAWLRRSIIALGLMPNTLQGRERFKRLVYGRLRTTGAEVQDGMAQVYPLLPISGDTPNADYKILYALARAQ